MSFFVYSFFVFSFLILFIAFLFRQDFDFVGHRKPCDLSILEEKLIDTLYSDHMSNKWLDVEVNGNIWKSHYIYSFPKTSTSKGRLLFLHGYGTTSVLAWRSVFPRLMDDYEIFAIDLPGFGRSIADDGLYNEKVQTKIIDSYCDFYLKILNSLNITEAFIVAHSFGGFVFSHCSVRLPIKISGLLLADVPGFFPNNGGSDYLWASFFVFGFPHTVVRMFGQTGHNIVRGALELLDVEIDDLLLDYWFQVRLNCNCTFALLTRTLTTFFYD